MNQFDMTSLTRVAGVLTVTAGVIAGAVIEGSIMANAGAGWTATNQVDPSIPAITIVAKRLNSAEKDRFERHDRASPANAAGSSRVKASGARAGFMLGPM